jgi:hypothetical protein
MCISRAHPHLHCSTYDLPNLEAAARAYLQEHSSSVEASAAAGFAPSTKLHEHAVMHMLGRRAPSIQQAHNIGGLQDGMHAVATAPLLSGLPEHTP